MLIGTRIRVLKKGCIKPVVVAVTIILVDDLFVQSSKFVWVGLFGMEIKITCVYADVLESFTPFPKFKYSVSIPNKLIKPKFNILLAIVLFVQISNIVVSVVFCCRSHGWHFVNIPGFLKKMINLVVITVSNTFSKESIAIVPILPDNLFYNIAIIIAL